MGLAIEFMVASVLNGGNMIYDKLVHKAKTILQTRNCNPMIPKQFFLDVNTNNTFENCLKYSCLSLAAQHRNSKFIYLNERWLTQTKKPILNMVNNFHQEIKNIENSIQKLIALILKEEQLDELHFTHGQSFVYRGHVNTIPYTVKGEIDFILNKYIILEIKFIQQTLTTEHILQLALYLLSLKLCNPCFSDKPLVGYLVNLNCFEVYKIELKPHLSNTLLNDLVTSNVQLSCKKNLPSILKQKRLNDGQHTAPKSKRCQTT
jgi:hypothetical protein